MRIPMAICQIHVWEYVIFLSVFLFRLFPPVLACQMRSKALACYCRCRLALLFCNTSFTINSHWTLDLTSVKMAVILSAVTCIDNPLGHQDRTCVCNAGCWVRKGECGMDKRPESRRTRARPM